jgi:hypothetical protein
MLQRRIGGGVDREADRNRSPASNNVLSYRRLSWRLAGKDSYCPLTIKPKLEKFKRIFSKVLKEEK